MPADRAATELEAMSVQYLLNAGCAARVHDRRDELLAIVAELQRRIDTARDEGRREALAALLPFAKLLSLHHADMEDDRPIFGICGSVVTVGHLREAARITAPAPVGESA